MDNAALAGVVVGYAVMFILDLLPGAVSCRCNRRFAFTAANDFDAAMIDSDAAPFCFS